MDEKDITSLAGRISRLEDWRHEVEKERAVEAERDAYLAEKFTGLEQRLTKIDSHIGRVIWLIVIGIASAVGNFILSGGLNGAN